MSDYERGTRVSCPRGLGRIAYRRMAPPDYNVVASYSIILDDTLTSVVFPADQVSALTEEK